MGSAPLHGCPASSFNGPYVWRGWRGNESGLCGHIAVDDVTTAAAKLKEQGIHVRSSAAGITLLPPLNIDAAQLADGLRVITQL